MKVLALDTATAAVTAGLVELTAERIDVLAARAIDAPRGHGELLAPAIEQVLHDGGIGPGGLAAVVVGCGPGPYTGLRVGLVTAAVMADVLRIPAYAVCTLDAIAAAADPVAGELLVATDARRREVYWARYRDDVRLAGPGVDRPVDLELAGVTAAGGAGARLYSDVWPGLPVSDGVPTPLGLVHCARERALAGAPPDPLTPLYLRRPDAVVPGAPKAVIP